MTKELKKSLVELACELKFGPAFVYVRESAFDAPRRFFFNIAGSSRMWNCVKYWRKQGCLVSTWCPPKVSL